MYISLYNIYTYIYTVVGVLVKQCKYSAQASTHSSQRGFVSGRQLTTNVVDMDAAGRILGMSVAAHNNTHNPAPSARKIALIFFPILQPPSLQFPMNGFSWS